MNYLQEIENRSMFLWQSLFGEEISADWDTPVYIDGAAAALQKAAAAQEERLHASEEALAFPEAAAETSTADEARKKPVQAAQSSADTPQRAMESGTVDVPAEPVLRGLADSAAEVLLHQIESTAIQAAPQRRAAIPAAAEDAVDTAGSMAAAEGETPPGEAAGKEQPPDVSSQAALQTSSPAAALLARVRQTEQSAAAITRGAPAASTQEPVRAANPRLAGPADWSLCFEKDARRYDGAYELL